MPFRLWFPATAAVVFLVLGIVQAFRGESTMFLSTMMMLWWIMYEIRKGKGGGDGR